MVDCSVTLAESVVCCVALAKSVVACCVALAESALATVVADPSTDEVAGVLLLLEEPGACVQLLSSRNACCPLTVIGVRVTVHVSVIGPDDP